MSGRPHRLADAALGGKAGRRYLLEIVEPNEAINASFERVLKAAETWDGKTDPIRINQPDGSYRTP